MKKLKLWLTLGVVLATLIGSSASYAYQALELDGSGYASISGGSQVGLNMGLSDFMVEVRIKTSDAGTQRLIIKETGAVGYRISVSNGVLLVFIGDTNGYTASNLGTASCNDGRWHTITFVFDRSGNCTGYIDGSSVGTVDISSRAGDIDNFTTYYLGCLYPGTGNFTGQSDELRIWDFSKNGLPVDYASYITWRAAARNVFLDMSEYDSDAWAGYADADRTDLVTNGDMEADSTWAPRGTPTTEEQSTDQANGGSNSWKIISDAAAEGAYQDITTVVGEYYEVTGYIYVTAGDAKLGKEDTDGSDQVLTGQATAAAWTEFNVIFLATETTSRIFFQSDATAASTFYVDDVSVKRTGLVARYKFEGDYTDETTNSNDLTAGGTGNVFPDYTLKKQKIISPFSVK